jgi:hypothetical protein
MSGNILTQYQRTTDHRAPTAPSFPDPFEDDPQPRARPGRRTPRHAVTQRQSASSPVVKSPGKAKSAEKENTPFVAKSSGGNNFSNEEKQLLLNGYDAIMNIDEDQAINAWAAWAVEVKTLNCPIFVTRHTNKY